MKVLVCLLLLVCLASGLHINNSGPPSRHGGPPGPNGGPPGPSYSPPGPSGGGSRGGQNNIRQSGSQGPLPDQGQAWTQPNNKLGSPGPPSRGGGGGGGGRVGQDTVRQGGGQGQWQGQGQAAAAAPAKPHTPIQGCYHNNMYYKPMEDAVVGKIGDMCYGYYCEGDNAFVHWEDACTPSTTFLNQPL